MNKMICITMCSCGLLVAGCTNDYSGNKYEAATVGEVSRTDQGTIMSIRKVELKQDGGVGAGTAIGAVGGGLLGSAFGGGDGKYLTTAAGAVLGGVAGHAIENRTQEGFEYTVKLDSGALVTIAQGPTPALSVGQRVNIINSNRGRSRIVAA